MKRLFIGPRQTRSWVVAHLLAFCLLSLDSLADDFTVALTQLKVADLSSPQPIEVALWYPTHAEPSATPLRSYTVNVALEATPVEILKGVVLIAHGFSGHAYGHYDTAYALAQSGFVVVSPTYPDQSGLQAQRPERDPLVARPQQTQRVLNTVLSMPPFKTLLPDPQIGLLGFSLGAYTALVTMGATPTLNHLGGYCQRKPNDALLCAAHATQRLAALTLASAVQQGPRIQAAVLLAPAYGPLFSDQTLRSITAPMLIYSAADDQALDNEHHARRFDAQLKDSRHLVIENAGHFVFLAPCPEALNTRQPHLCRDAASVDRALIHQQINTEVLQFFNAHLYNPLAKQP